MNSELNPELAAALERARALRESKKKEAAAEAVTGDGETLFIQEDLPSTNDGKGWNPPLADAVKHQRFHEHRQQGNDD